LSYIIDAYHKLNAPDNFWRRDGFFELLIGVDYVREMIENGAKAEEIKARWAPDVEKFETQRTKYLIYN
ncbi:MAG: DUF1343 domain-containing protein, partial [Bacteroidales bacterium]|nr:DUF1343 domain-containing protein [Bacteroidales bacterium]